MDRRVLVAIAAVMSVLLAGCGGLGAGGVDTPESTPTETVPASPSPTPPPTATPDPQYPAGWSEAGVQNATVAIDSHYRAVIAGPSATVTYRSQARVANGTGNSTALEMTYNTGDQRLYASLDGKSTQREVYFADGMLTQWSVQNESVAARSNPRFTQVVQSIDRRVLLSQLLTYRLEHNRTVDRNGTTVFVYDVAGVYDNTVSNTYGAAESGSGYVTVTSNGRVLELETRVTYVRGNVTYTYAHTQLGRTTVETPAWARE